MENNMCVWLESIVRKNIESWKKYAATIWLVLGVFLVLLDCHGFFSLVSGDHYG